MQTLSQFQDFFKQYLSQNTFEKEPKELYEPINYILSLGGKQLRPILLLMAHQLFKDDVTASLPAALAVEVFHNFTLLHDDIMDKAPLRRGKPTVHEKYDQNIAILSGDAMMIYAYHFLNQCSDKAKIPQLFSIFNKVAIEVCEGQQMDMNFEKTDDVQLPAYLKMIELKTSVLLAGAMQMGAIIGGANQQDAAHIYEFGRNIGIAFQIQDDILDTFGDPEKFGKRVGGDIIQNKKTYLVLKTLEVADEKGKQALKKLMNTPTTDEITKIKEVKSIFNQYQIRALAAEKKDAYQQIAFQHLVAIGVEESRKKLLKSLAATMIKREV